MSKKVFSQNLKDYLDENYEKFNQPQFIDEDPICIPHLFSNKQDIEIMGLWAAVLAWGQRKTIISKCKELIVRMEGSPYDFVKNHDENDLKNFIQFKHRTFNTTDTLYFLSFLKEFYQRHQSLEEAFLFPGAEIETNTEKHLIHFHNRFFSLPYFPVRTQKHIPTPKRKSACKRLNMMLRWFVRNDRNGVDFGIWKNIKSSQLVCPCDVHVDRVARDLGLLERKQTDWQSAVELTENLKSFDANDPVKYDFALFGIGIAEKKFTRQPF